MTNIPSNELRTLAQLLHDSHDGYRKCAEDISDRTLQQHFSQLSQKRKAMLQALEAEAKSIGEEKALSETEGSVLASGHRLFIDLKSILSGGDKKAILREVERGENHLISQYEKIIQGDYELPAGLRNLLHDQVNTIKTDLEELGRL